MIAGFLTRLRMASGASGTASSPEARVADSVLSTRFLTQSNHKSTTAVRKRAFEPMFDAERHRFETSVYRISGLTGVQVQQIADTEVVAKRGIAVLARGDIRVQMVHKHASLRVVVDEPPARHAVILGWPGTPDEGKDRRMDLQNELARDATLRRVSDTPPP